MVTHHELIGDALVFHAESGEWFNRPGTFMDMDEDAEERPPSRWHVELKQAIDRLETSPHSVVIDLTGMAYLVGVDWGFLIPFCNAQAQRGTDVTLAAGKNVIAVVDLIKRSHVFHCRAFHSVAEALGQG